MRSHPAIEIGLSIAVCLIAAWPAAGQDFGRSGFYAGAGAIAGDHTAIEDEFDNVDADTAIGFELFGGYRFHPNFAVEGEFEMLPDTDIDVQAGGLDHAGAIRTWSATGNLKIFVLPWRVQPYLLLGLGAMQFDVDSSQLDDDTGTEVAIRFGGGLDVYLTDQIALYAAASYLLEGVARDTFSYLSYGGGLLLRF